jgi:ubiquitin C-terminal hydrolase
LDFIQTFEQIPIARKITKVVKISKTLNLTDFKNNRGSELRYRLVAVISHIGNSLGDGHYTTIALCPDGRYYKFNDDTVSGQATQNGIKKLMKLILCFMKK